MTAVRAAPAPRTGGRLLCLVAVSLAYAGPRRLLEAIEAAATEAGVTELITHASWRAAPVFERRGFRQLEVETVLVGDQLLTRALMRKQL